jgi:NAD(P)-dependent dehydrogenase (short-subunit alcohol dehydrogenase family)
MKIRSVLSRIFRLVAGGTPSRPAVVPAPRLERPAARRAPETHSARLLDGRNVLITGGGSGIGRGIALEMAAHGANIYFTDIDGRSRQSLLDELAGAGVQATGFDSDVASSQANEELSRQLLAQGVTIDVLVNNAGIRNTPPPGAGAAREDLDRLFAVNVIGPLDLTARIVERMSAQGVRGSVLFIGSMHQQAVFGDAAYSASKAALAMAVRELAWQHAAAGIRVNGIAPGAVGQEDGGAASLHPYTPLGGHKLVPAHIGRAAVMLSSDYFAERITGCMLPVDGGLALHSYMTMMKPPPAHAQPVAGLEPGN